MSHLQTMARYGRHHSLDLEATENQVSVPLEKSCVMLWNDCQFFFAFGQF